MYLSVLLFALDLLLRSLTLDYNNIKKMNTKLVVNNFKFLQPLSFSVVNNMRWKWIETSPWTASDSLIQPPEVLINFNRKVTTFLLFFFVFARNVFIL